MRPDRVIAGARSALRQILEPRSLIGEITRWSLGLLLAGLIVGLVVTAFARRTTAANLADFDLVGFLESEIARAIDQCPDGFDLCYDQIAQNETGGIWTMRLESGRAVRSFSFAVSAFASGIPPCARDDPRHVLGYDIFTCAPTDGALPYRVAARADPDGDPTAFVALEESAWSEKVERAAGHLAAWRSLRTAVWVMGLTLLIALGVNLYLLRDRLRRHFGRLGAALDAWRLGDAARIEGAYPREIEGVVASFNRALEKNDGLIARQRRNVQKMAHDLRHQLVNVDVAARGDDPQAVGPELETLGKLVERYLTLVDWVGPMEGQAPVDVRETLLAMQRAFSRRLRIEPVDIAVDCAEGLTARIHPTDLRIILSNLMSNAHKHAAGRIRLSALAQDGALRLSVEDDGPGVPEAERARILDWGTRLDARAPGSGFGLTIVAEQVSELYGGALALDASPLGGLRATVRLPILGQRPRRGAPPPDADPSIVAGA